MVKASERGTSGIEFLRNLRDNEVYFVKMGSKKPKKFRTLFVDELIKLSASAYNNAKAGNSIYVTNEMEYNLRRRYMYQAYCEIQMLISQTEVWYAAYGSDLFSNAELCENAKRLNIAGKMIRSIMDSDKQRFKNKK